jgi:transcriptional regulator with XRE-family HTH domain
LLDSISVKTLRKSLGERVRQLRRESGVSQEDFADACGFARSYMSRIERGTSNLSLDGIERLAEAFGISVGELLKDL